MSGDDNASVLYGVIFLALLLPALFARRLPFGNVMKMVLAWVGIFAALFIVFSFRGQFAEVWKSIKMEIVGSSVENDGTMRIARSDNGHFMVTVSINGRDTRMLIDSGASVTSISTAKARELGIEVDMSGFPVIVETANGMAEARRATANTLSVGPIKRTDFPIQVGDGIGDEGLLGMNFLDTLGGWRVEGSTMILNPTPSG
jgi:aspartyl protease family protein